MALRGKITAGSTSTPTTVLSLTGKGILKTISWVSRYNDDFTINIDGQGAVNISTYMYALTEEASTLAIYRKTHGGLTISEGFASGVTGYAYADDDIRENSSICAVFNLPFATSLVISSTNTKSVRYLINTVLEI